MGEIKLNFTTKQGQQNVTVPADLVPLLRNQHVKVSGNMMKESPIEDTEFDIVFDIDVEDWESANSDITTRPLAAKIGDFIYKDGTFGNEYNEKAIGVIFALKENFTDNSDYGTAFEGKKIAGYAMALEGTDRIYIGPSKDGGFTDGTDITTLATTETYNADYTVRTYNGYEYSKAFNAILIILSNLCYSNNTRACEQSITIQLQILVTGTYLPHTRCTIFVPGFMASLLKRMDHSMNQRKMQR